MENRGRSHNRLVTIIILAITLILVVVIASDWEEMRSVLIQSDWRYLPVVLIFTVLSYTCYSYAFAFVSQMLDIRMGKRELAEVCFISAIVNHVLTTGGVVGYSLRYLLMKMYGISLKDTLTSSILHFYLTILDMLTFMPVMSIYLLLHIQMPRVIAILLGFMAVLFGLILIIFTMVVLFPTWRGPIIHYLTGLGQRLLRRDFLPWLTQMDETFTRGTEAMRKRPLILVWIMLLTLIDFTCSVVALGFCFDALGPPVQASALLAGYVIGIMAGLLSMVPGGFGVQEGSMAGIFMLFSVQFEQAVLATILFRIFYYLLPYLLIMLFYNRLLRQVKQQALSES